MPGHYSTTHVAFARLHGHHTLPPPPTDRWPSKKEVEFEGVREEEERGLKARNINRVPKPVISPININATANPAPIVDIYKYSNCDHIYIIQLPRNAMEPT